MPSSQTQPGTHLKLKEVGLSIHCKDHAVSQEEGVRKNTYNIRACASDLGEGPRKQDFCSGLDAV